MHSGPLPSHVEDTIRAIGALHAEHRRRASPVQRLIDRLTEALGTASALIAVLAFSIVWIAANSFLAARHVALSDPPPFAVLVLVLQIGASLVTLLILASQRHQDALADQRSQLTLQFAIVSDQKIAKLIELVEGIRRDSPQIADRVDIEAEAMATSVDPAAVLEAIAESQSDVTEPSPSQSRST